MKTYVVNTLTYFRFPLSLHRPIFRGFPLRRVPHDLPQKKLWGLLKPKVVVVVYSSSNSSSSTLN